MWRRLLLAGALLPQSVALAQNSVDEFELGGSATVASDDCIRLTPDQPFLTGSAWFAMPVDLSRGFQVRLSLVLGLKDPNGADGIAFVLHPGMGTGWRGEGMGFTGLSPSLGVEFDTYQNVHLGDPTSDHVAILLDGGAFHVGPSPIRVPNLEDGARHPLVITWHPDEGLSVALDGQALLSTPPEVLRQVFGEATALHWGMTAATGRLSNEQMICLEELLLSRGPPAEATFLAGADRQR